MGTFEITQEAKWAIRMWRAAFYLLVVDKKRYGRSMASFRPRDPDDIVETDGSLSQVGIILYKKGATDEACVGAAAVSLMSFGFGKDSSNQNLAEYLGMVMGILALILALNEHLNDLCVVFTSVYFNKSIVRENMVVPDLYACHNINLGGMK